MVVLTIACLGLLPDSAVAQSAPLLRHFELAGGIGVLTGAGLGDQNADLRTSTAGQPYRLFNSSSRIAAAPILDLRAGIALTRRYGVEAHAAYGHPELKTALSSDAEGAPAITAVERLDQYLIDGGGVVRFDEWTVHGFAPFAVAGAGYLRQLHEDLTVTAEGHLFFVGGGVKYGLVSRPRGWLRGIGARADGRVNVLSGGIEIGDSARTHIAVSGSVFVVF